MVPQRFYVHQQRGGGDRHLYAARTRFIPDRLLPLFAKVTWPAAGATAGRRVEDGPRIDIGARMRGMWR
jgi:DNA helicase-2/ATP-dependent DNA helicase PcrA